MKAMLWTAIAVLPFTVATAVAEGAAAEPESSPPAIRIEARPPPAQPPPADVPLSKPVTAGTGGLFQPGLLLQGWFLADHSTETTSTFRLRRAEIKLRGEIVSGLIGYGLMIDPAKVLEFKDTTLSVGSQDPAAPSPADPETVTAKQPSSAVSMLQDFFLTVKSSYVDVSAGQFKVPVSWEGYNSSAELLFPERARVSREFGDRRDLGLRLSKSFRYFGYSAGVFNGAGQNSLDTSNDKDVALRLEAYPLEGLVLAAVVYATVGERKSNVKDRYEADVRWARGPFLFQAEYIRAHDIGKDARAVDAQGFYSAVAWTFFEVLQPCLRFGFLDPDVRADVKPTSASGKDEVWHVDAGLNYYLQSNTAKLQLAYSRFQFDSRPANNELIVVGQISF